MREDDRLVLSEELSEVLVVDAGVDRPGEFNDPSPDGHTHAAWRGTATVPTDVGASSTTTIRLPEQPRMRTLLKMTMPLYVEWH